MTYQEIKSFINTYIVQNGVNAITGSLLNTALNALADYYGFDSVVVTTLPAGSDATVNVQGRTLELGIPKGADGEDGRDGLDATNPFKGWFNSLDDLKASYTASVGDSAYVKDASPATTWSIYVYDSTALSDNYWADSGTDADTSNVQTFASGEEVNEVHIVNNLKSGGINDVLSAEQGKAIGEELFHEDELDLIPSAEILSSTNIGKDGELTTNNSYSVYKITNQNYTRLTGQASGGTFQSKYYLIAFYNGGPSTSTFISGIKPTVNNTEESFDTTVPSGTIYILVSRYQSKPIECNTIIDVSKIEELGLQISTISETANSASATANSAITKADNCREVIDDFVIKNDSIVKTIADDFTISGRYDDSSTDIVSGDWISCLLIQVNEGEKIYFHNWRAYPNSLPFAWLYDNDGVPYKGEGTNARVLTTNPAFILISESESGNEYEFTIPTNGGLIGLAVPTSGVNPTGASVSIGDESYEFTEEAIDMINSVVDGDIESAGDRTANYYLKGNVYILSSNKKLGIIAAGQSNIDGRNSYSDYPYLSTNPNPKVKFCDNINGVFSNFEVIDGGVNNDWSFDAIVYNLLTEISHGNQDEIYVMKKSKGGTSIDINGATNYHWTADYEYLTSPTYSLLLDFESVIRKAVELQGSNFEIKAFLWHQGEGDSGSVEVANRYYENLKNMLAYVRGVVGNPRLHFFCGNLSMNRSNNTYVPIINTAYAQLEAEDPYFHCVDMSNAILEDAYHFNYIWSIYFGQKVYDMMIDAGIINGTKINPSEPT